MYELHEVNFSSGPDWDAEIARFDLRHVYHRAAWLDFIEQTQPVTRRIYGLYEADELIGYLPGFVLRKGPVRIFGSPFPGWNTAYMGPVVNSTVDSAELFRALAATMKRDRFAHAEIQHPALDCTGAPAAGFRPYSSQTQIADVGATPEEILQSFGKGARYDVRMALRRGLEAVVTTDPAFVDVYYDQLRDVFGKYGTEPTYSRQRVRALWENLMPTGTIICTKIMKDDRCLATGIDLVGNGWLHAFGSASFQNYSDLKCCPNDLCRYHAFLQASRRGLSKYDMTGYRAYKRKFGAQVVDIPVQIRSNALLRAGRELFRRLHMAGMRRRGRVTPRGGEGA
ncbi:MAG TPA: GNAT family N-acetyltransferase [Armatimonadota bacterium]|jgi:hypothetical protein